MKRSILLMAALLAAGTVFAAGNGNGGRGSGTGSVASKWYELGYSASNAGKYQEAIGDFQNAISLQADYADAYNMMGFCTRKLGNVNEAFTYYEKALKLKPNFPEAREYYGEAYLQVGNLVGAVKQYIILEKARNKNARELLEKIEEFIDQKRG